MMGTLLPPPSTAPLPCSYDFTGQVSPLGHQAELGWHGWMESPEVPGGRMGTQLVLQACLRRAAVCSKLTSKRPLSPHPSSIFFPGYTLRKSPGKE